MKVCIMMLSFMLSSLFSFYKEESKTKDPLTILAIGDSITQGAKQTPSYLFFLQEIFYKAGYDVKFIGPRVSQYNNHSLHHSGYAGKNAEFLDSVVSATYTNYPADVVLIHAGHNYFTEDNPIQKIIDAQRSMVKKIKAINPHAKIFLAQVIPSGKMPKYGYIPELNKQIKTLTKELSKTYTAIYLVNQYKEFNYKKDAVEDLVHPNASGAKKIALTWSKEIFKQIK